MHTLVPTLHDPLQLLGYEPTLVNLHRHPADAVRQRCIRESVERELVRQEMITWTPKQPKALGHTVHVPDRERADMVSRRVVVVREFRNGLLGFWETCTSAIRHSGFDRNAAWFVPRG